MPSTLNSLAIIDAGIGGLGTYRAIKARSNIPLMYFADSGFEPYGLVPRRLLRQRLQRVFDFLYTQGADKIAVACNAASCALPEDGNDLTGNNVEGIVRHGVTAIERSGMKHVGIIGGAGTIRSQAYARRLREKNITVIQRIAQPLSIHVESGILEGAQLYKDLERILKPLRQTRGILLGCTHYPAISRQIRQHLDPDTQLIDPAELLADWMLENWSPVEHEGPDRWFTTGDPAKLVINGQRAFGVSINNPEQVNF